MSTASWIVHWTYFTKWTIWQHKLDSLSTSSNTTWGTAIKEWLH